MTDPANASSSSRKRRGGGPTAATRITTAGLAVAVTIGLGGAVAARAADQKRTDAKLSSSDTKSADPVIQSQVAAATARIQAAERARYEAKIKKMRDKYQKSLNSLAADYQSRLGGGSSGSTSSGGGSYSSSSGGGGSSSSSGGGSSSSSGGGGGSSSSGGGGGGSAPAAPSTSKGS